MLNVFQVESIKSEIFKFQVSFRLHAVLLHFELIIDVIIDITASDRCTCMPLRSLCRTRPVTVLLLSCPSFLLDVFLTCLQMYKLYFTCYL